MYKLSFQYHSLKDSRAVRFGKEQSQNEYVRTVQRLQEGSWKRVKRKKERKKEERKKNKGKILLFSSALSEGSQTSPASPSDMSRIKIKMRADHWWIDTERETSKYSEKNLYQYHFVPQKRYTQQPRQTGREACN